MLTSLSVIREQFPIYQNHPDLVYLDFASTALKPNVVIEAVSNYYTSYSANIHRGDHGLSALASVAYEDSRILVANFLGVRETEVIFTKNATEGINLVANSFLEPILQPYDEVIVTCLEHNSNFLPWQQIALKRNAKLIVPKLGLSGEFDYEAWCSSLSDRTKFAAFTCTSNVTGETLPVGKMINVAQAKGIPVLIDATQFVPHQQLDVSMLQADFIAISGHKCYGPTGVGVLVAKEMRVADMSPFLVGGGVVHQVSLADSQYKSGPSRFEAGTPAIASVIGFGESIRFMEEIFSKQSLSREYQLMDYIRKGLRSIKGIQIIGPELHSSHLISFCIEGVHSHDLAIYLDLNNIAVRSGKHCAHPLLSSFGEDSLLRISLGVTNDETDVSRVLDVVERGAKLLVK